jgi:Secretion system C-terminal sorting domain
MGIDSADGYVYVGQTDYLSYGNVFIYDLFGHAIDSFAVDVSPGNFAFDVRTLTGIPTTSANPLSVNVYPNPTSSILNVTVAGNVSLQKISLTDALGKTVYEKLMNNSRKTIALNIENYRSGVYFLTVQTSDGTMVHNKIVKQ